MSIQLRHSLEESEALSQDITKIFISFLDYHPMGT